MVVSAGRRQGRRGADQSDSPHSPPQLSSTGHLRGLPPLVHRQQSRRRGQRAYTQSSRHAFGAAAGPETSRRVQTPRRSLPGPVLLQNTLPGTLSSRNHYPQTLGLCPPVRQFFNSVPPPASPSSPRRAPPLPASLRLTAAILECAALFL